MRRSKKIVTLALAALLALSATSCARRSAGISEFDAKTYVDGLLRETYFGEASPEYMELVGIDEDEAQQTYEAGISNEVSFFINLYEIEYPEEELYEELTGLYKEIYSHAKFEVTDAVKMDDGSFSVQVVVEPIDIVQLADTEWDKTIAPFYEDYPMETQYAMTTEEYQAMDREYAQLVLDLYKDKLKETGNMTAKTILVSVAEGENGAYTISQDDFSKLDELIIDYTDNVGASA